MLTQEQIRTALCNVIDPELGISIVDLGLVYEINLESKTPADNPASEPEQHVHLVMTLTTIGCPLYGVIETDIRTELLKIGLPPERVEIELVFEPPWSMERMSESARAMLGI
ncbi:MAG: metal-sulfur cluster assembly factor [Patescibacteria group bacterium]|nr:metal-sulfur cluster assembly factor [Patescibacteria group bacterium]